MENRGFLRLLARRAMVCCPILPQLHPAERGMIFNSKINTGALRHGKVHGTRRHKLETTQRIMVNINFNRVSVGWALLLILSLATSGCKNLPGSPGAQGAAIGGVGGAAAGAAIGGEHHRVLGALVGGAVGAGGGYLIGANKDRLTQHDTAGAQAAVQRAQQNPASPQDALTASTADLNRDGFVTMDEVVAMKRAGFSDQQIFDRMRATGQVFELTPQQQDYLRNNGLDQYVIDQIPGLNRETAVPTYGGAYNQPYGQAPVAIPPNPGQPYGQKPVAPPPNPGLTQPVPPPPAP